MIIQEIKLLIKADSIKQYLKELRQAIAFTFNI